MLSISGYTVLTDLRLTERRTEDAIRARTDRTRRLGFGSFLGYPIGPRSGPDRVKPKSRPVPASHRQPPAIFLANVGPDTPCPAAAFAPLCGCVSGLRLQTVRFRASLGGQDSSESAQISMNQSYYAVRVIAEVFF